MKKLAFILVAAIAALFSEAAYADDYRSRPITIVNVFGPGSGNGRVLGRADPVQNTSLVADQRYSPASPAIT